LPVACLTASDRAIRKDVLSFALFDEASESSPSFLLFAANMTEHAASIVLDYARLDGLLGASAAVLLEDCTNSLQPSQLLSRSEFIHEEHIVDLLPHDSMLWLVKGMHSVDAATILEQSIERLIGLISSGVRPAGNLIYEALRPHVSNATEFEGAVSKLCTQLCPSALDRFSRCLHSLAFHFHETGILRAPKFAGSPSVQDPPTTILSLFDTVAKLDTLGGLACRRALEHNEMRTVVLVSAEVGRFSTVGGVGVVVDELSQSLARLKFRVVVISPYFNYNKFGKTGWLAAPFKHIGNIATFVGPEREEFGVWRGTENGVDLVFLHNYRYFPNSYAGEQSDYKLRCAVALAKAAL
jgi:starch synthase